MVWARAVEEDLEVFYADQPRAAAVVWLLSASMIQPSAGVFGPRSTRELRLLCHSLDPPIQGMVAQVMDVLAQGVKAPE